MTLLHWFPFSPAEWEKKIQRVSLEEEGAMIRVVREAWTDPEYPCTIQDTDAALDSLLGSRWRKVEAVVRQHFVRCPEHPGRLRCEWLWALYQAQVGKYEKRAAAGGRGRAETRRRRANDAESIANDNADSNAGSKASSNAGRKARAKVLALRDAKQAQKLDGRGTSPVPSGPGGSTDVPPPESARGACALEGAPLASPHAAGADGLAMLAAVRERIGAEVQLERHRAAIVHRADPTPIGHILAEHFPATMAELEPTC